MTYLVATIFFDHLLCMLCGNQCAFLQIYDTEAMLEFSVGQSVRSHLCDGWGKNLSVVTVAKFKQQRKTNSRCFVCIFLPIICFHNSALGKYKWIFTKTTWKCFYFVCFLTLPCHLPAKITDATSQFNKRRDKKQSASR